MRVVMKQSEEETTENSNEEHKDGVLGTTKAFCKITGKLLKKTANCTEKVVVKTKDAILTPLHHKKKEEDKIKNEEVAEEAVALVSPDETLQSMDIIVEKTLKGVTVQNFFDICWKEDESPLYYPWLESMGYLDVEVGKWEIREEGDDNHDSLFVGNWDEERYPMKRVVTFRKPPSAFSSSPIPVKHTQHGRYDDQRCVVSMMVEMQGIPFADSFHVQIRWVATRVGRNNLRIQVGVFVVFSKSNILASKIRSKTISSTTEMQSSLMTCMKEACRADGGEYDSDGEEEMMEERVGSKSKSIFRVILQSLASILAPFVAVLIVEVLKIPSAKQAIADVVEMGVTQSRKKE
mmetsp:Transcript_1981/g.3031  ORF Transcript_1981/g.3031 Transcript_1981/m.3031 type:complete len:349 (+) Transcript_1981:60-1106(+)